MSGESYLVQVEKDSDRLVRYALLSAADAKALFCGSSLSSLHYRLKNEHLLGQLGRVEPPKSGVRVSDVLQAAADAAPLSREVKANLKEFGFL
jgi:hypothetical protein